MVTTFVLAAIASCATALVPIRPATRARLAPTKSSFSDDFLSDIFDEADSRSAAVESYEGNGVAGGYEGSGSGGWHDYERAGDDDGSPVDAAAVDALLAERVSFKKRRLFEEADAIRDELRDAHGVTVWDRDRVWRTGPDPRANGRGGPRGGGRRNSRDLGPRGHDYERVGGPSVSGMAEADVDALLAERLQAKFARNFAVADDIQAELINSGVRVHDGMKSWRDDGEGFGDDRGDGRPGRERGSRSDRDRPYAKAPESDPLVDDDEEAEIAKLVAERLQCKKDRDYDRADAIRDTLRDTYDCFVDDRSRLWCVGAEPRDPRKRDRDRPYERRGGGGLSDADAAKIQADVDARAAAKADRNFDVADAIRDALRDDFGVSIDDRSREWRVMSEDYAPSLNSAPLDAATTAEVAALLKERAAAKRDRDYGTADDIRDRLRDDFGVTVDDRVKEWTAAGARAAPAPAAAVEAEDAGPAFAILDDDDDDDGDDVAVVGDAAAPAAGGAAPSGDDLEKLTIPELKDILRDAGLKVGGKKAELVDRILEARSA